MQSLKDSNDATSLAIHPEDAVKLGVADGGRVRIVTKTGAAVIDIRHDDRQWPGSVATP